MRCRRSRSSWRMRQRVPGDGDEVHTGTGEGGSRRRPSRRNRRKRAMAISAQDRPRYDGWGPDRPWGCIEWIEWHRALAAAYGEQYADGIWVPAWLDGLSRAAEGRGTAPGSGAI